MARRHLRGTGALALTLAGLALLSIGHPRGAGAAAGDSAWTMTSGGKSVGFTVSAAGAFSLPGGACSGSVGGGFAGTAVSFGGSISCAGYAISVSGSGTADLAWPASTYVSGTMTETVLGVPASGGFTMTRDTGTSTTSLTTTTTTSTTSPTSTSPSTTSSLSTSTTTTEPAPTTTTSAAPVVRPGSPPPCSAAYDGTSLVICPSGHAIDTYSEGGGTISVAPASEIEVPPPTPQSDVIDLWHGVVKWVHRALNGDKLRVWTPAAVAGVRGTSFVASYRSHVLRVWVITGSVVLSERNGSHPTIVHAGQSSSASSGRPPTSPHAFAPRSLDAWWRL